MDDLVQRLQTAGREVPTAGGLLHEAAERIEKLTAGVVEQCNANTKLRVEMEQLERENEANERNLCQLTDDLAASRRENAELRKQLQAEHERQHRVWTEIERQQSEKALQKLTDFSQEHGL